MSTFAFEKHDSSVRDPYCSVALRSSPAFPFGNDWTPWGHWDCDRFLGFFGTQSFLESPPEEPGDAVEAFQADQTPQTARDLAIYLQGFTSFDGELAFIPASHAEDFYAHMERFVAGALSGEGNTPEDTVSDDVSLGYEDDDVVAIWGHSTPDGLFLLFAMSCDTIGEGWLESAFRRYPKRDELEQPAGQAGFDPTRAYFHIDCHLADHLYPGREPNNPGLGAFLAWAFQRGHLTNKREDV